MEVNEMEKGLQALAQLLAPHLSERQKHDLPAVTNISNVRVHGNGGIFSTAGIERSIFSTRVVPQGLMSVLPPPVMTNDTHPIVGYLTGFTAGSGSEQDYPCDSAPIAGQMKSCLQGSAFGRIARATQTIDISNQGDRINRGEMFDLQLVNDPLLSNPEALVPPGIPKSMASALASEVLGRFIALGVEFEDVLSHMIWTGNPANNSANSGYMEYVGMEGLVVTTHTDVITSANCPSLASDVRDFGRRRVDQAAAALFNELTSMWRIANHNARKMNMMPVQWAWVMPEPLFRELTDYWPCVYASFRCGATGNDISNNTDALVMRQMTNDMYNGKYLIIDNVKIPVVTDDAMPVVFNEDNGNVPSGCGMGDIYLLPFVVKGGTRVLFFETFNFAAPGAAVDAINRGLVANTVWIDSGRWLTAVRSTLFCFDWTAVIRPRLRLLTPHLAGRLQNVMFCPLKFPRDSFHDSPYFLDGGNLSISSAPYSYSSLGRQ